VKRAKTKKTQLAKELVYYCVEYPSTSGARGATYGCSRVRSEAERALARAHARGQTRLTIMERPTRARGVRGWLPPCHER
jgi:hypothetical protein